MRFEGKIDLTVEVFITFHVCQTWVPHTVQLCLANIYTYTYAYVIRRHGRPEKSCTHQAYKVKAVKAVKR